MSVNVQEIPLTNGHIGRLKRQNLVPVERYIEILYWFVTYNRSVNLYTEAKKNGVWIIDQLRVHSQAKATFRAYR